MTSTTTSSKPGKLSIQNIALSLLTLLILGFLFRALASFLQPFFIAIFFFYITQPIMKWLIEKRVPAFVAQLVPLILVVAVLFLIGWVIGAHVDNLAERFPAYKQKFQGLFQGGLSWVFDNLPVVGEELRAVFSGQRIPLGPLEGVLKAIVGNFFGFISFALFVVFFLIFIIQEAVTLPKRIEGAYGQKRADQILEIGQRINKGIIGYVYVKGCASLVVALLSIVAMLSFRLDLAVFWGTLTFFANFIPYVGSALAVIFPIVIALLQFGSLGSVVALALILVACQLFVGNFLEPKFAGQQLNLSPLVVLLSLTFWGWLWGIVGLILSIPIMVSLKFILENIPATRDLATLMSHVTKKK